MGCPCSGWGETPFVLRGPHALETAVACEIGRLGGVGVPARTGRIAPAPREHGQAGEAGHAEQPGADRGDTEGAPVPGPGTELQRATEMFRMPT